MDAFWEGVVAGYGIAIPVGAIAVLIVDTALRRGFTIGFMAGAGAATGDLLFASLAVIAGATLAMLLAPLAAGLQAASGLLLITIGTYGLWRTRRIDNQQIPEPGTFDGHGHMRTYGQFLGLTMLNPMTIAYFGALILGRQGSTTVTTADRLAFVVGAGLASLSWQTLLAGTGALARQYLSPQFRIVASLVGNLVVILLGVRILLK